MSNMITLNVELSPEALRRQSLMLGQMADVIEMLPKSGNAGDQLIEDLNKGQTQTPPAPPAPPISAAVPLPSATPTPPPAPPAAPTPGPGIAGEVDADGLPWDGRIHSSSKKMTADGRWKVARNMDPETVKKVRAELIALRDAAKGGAPVAPAPVAPAPAPIASTVATPPAPPAPPAAPPAAPPFVNLMTGQPPAPPAAPAPAPAPVADDPAEQAKKFTAVLNHISSAINAKQITAPQVNEVLSKHGIPQLGLLSKRPDLFDIVKADIDAAILLNQIAASR